MQLGKKTRKGGCGMIKLLADRDLKPGIMQVCTVAFRGDKTKCFRKCKTRLTMARWWIGYVDRIYVLEACLLHMGFLGSWGKQNQ